MTLDPRFRGDDVKMSEKMTHNRDPGRLNRRMVLEAPQDTDDGAGGAVRAWTTEREFWAQLLPVSARFAAEGGSAGQRITHELFYRTGPALTTEKRLRFGARLFGILHVRDATEDGTRQMAMVEEVKA